MDIGFICNGAPQMIAMRSSLFPRLEPLPAPRDLKLTTPTPVLGRVRCRSCGLGGWLHFKTILVILVIVSMIQYDYACSCSCYFHYYYYDS